MRTEDYNVTARSASGIDIVLGRNIAAARKVRGMSQQHLGDELGVSFQQIQKYEKGANRVSAARLVEIAGTLNVAIGDLFAGIVDASATGFWHEVETSEETAFLNAIKRVTGAHNRNLLLGMAKLLEKAA